MTMVAPITTVPAPQLVVAEYFQYSFLTTLPLSATTMDSSSRFMPAVPSGTARRSLVEPRIPCARPCTNEVTLGVDPQEVEVEERLLPAAAPFGVMSSETDGVVDTRVRS